MPEAGSPPKPASPAYDPETRLPERAANEHEEVVLTLAAEEIIVGRQAHRTTSRVSTTTVERSQHIEVPLRHRRVEIKRVPINRTIASVPPTREIDGVTILPVVEEVVVVERQLVLKEEIHVRQVIVEDQHTEDVVFRTQEVDVTRTELGTEPSDLVASDDPTFSSKETER